MFGICSLILMQLPFSFRESSAIFTDMSLFTVITTGDTKKSSSTSFIFSKCPDLFNFSNSLLTSSCRCSGTFCFTGKCPGFSCIFFRYLLLIRCFQTIHPEYWCYFCSFGYQDFIFCLLFSYSIFT